MTENEKGDKRGGQKKERDSGSFSEVIKKVVSIGVGAAFLTEDTIKSVLQDLPLPKDIVSGLVQNAKSAKEEFTKSVGEEIRDYLSSVDPKVMMDELLDNYDVEVNATFKFKKKSSAPNGKKNT